MCGANKLTDNMELVLSRDEYFSALCFHALYSIRSNFRKWFVSQNMEPLSLRSTSQGVFNARVLMNMLAIRQFFPNAGCHDIGQPPFPASDHHISTLVTAYKI